jgi:hypothetical protein
MSVLYIAENSVSKGKTKKFKKYLNSSITNLKSVISDEFKEEIVLYSIEYTIMII